MHRREERGARIVQEMKKTSRNVGHSLGDVVGDDIAPLGCVWGWVGRNGGVRCCVAWGGGGQNGMGCVGRSEVGRGGVERGGVGWLLTTGY